jgi:murein DD-endopeptidase MepM/ murein hydrolase activator NlpD
VARQIPSPPFPVGTKVRLKVKDPRGEAVKPWVAWWRFNKNKGYWEAGLQTISGGKSIMVSESMIEPVVTAIEAGIVTQAEEMPGLGNVVKIEH